MADQSGASHRFLAVAGVLFLALIPVSCSATREHVRPDGDVVLRSGPTTLGWVEIVGAATLVAVFLVVFVVGLVSILGEELAEGVRSRRFRPAAGGLLFCLFGTGVVAVMGWGVATNTVLKYQTTQVTASRGAHELSVRRTRLIGDDDVRRWHYRQIARIEFEYVPGSPGNEGPPPQGIVSVRTADGEHARIFDGSPCPARSLADAVTSATGVPIEVDEGGRDLSSWSAFATQLRCGIAEPFRPKGWRDYPAETSRVLELAPLARWPWLFPFLAAQLTLIAALLTIDRRWLEPLATTTLRIAVWVPAVLAAAAIHVLAARSYGSWPAALVVLALISMKLAATRLGFTFRGMLRRSET